MTAEVVAHRGWEIIRLTQPPLQVDVVAEKGGDILAIRWLPLGINLLWESPWGLPEKGAMPAAKDSVDAFMQMYPGGWQTLFPNAGAAAVEDGVEWGFHGEASMTSWEVLAMQGDTEQSVVRLKTELQRSPFTLERTVHLTGDAVTVTETVGSFNQSMQHLPQRRWAQAHQEVKWLWQVRKVMVQLMINGASVGARFTDRQQVVRGSIASPKVSASRSKQSARSLFPRGGFSEPRIGTFQICACHWRTG